MIYKMYNQIYAIRMCFKVRFMNVPGFYSVYAFKWKKNCSCVNIYIYFCYFIVGK